MWPGLLALPLLRHASHQSIGGDSGGDSEAEEDKHHKLRLA